MYSSELLELALTVGDALTFIVELRRSDGRSFQVVLAFDPVEVLLRGGIRCLLDEKWAHVTRVIVVVGESLEVLLVDGRVLGEVDWSGRLVDVESGSLLEG